MRWMLFVVMVGCADVPDSDVDGDGVADAEDDCIAGAPDEALDIDGDGKDATDDLCPHDRNAVAGDNDFDGIPEACDPFPVDMTRPDRRRCVTSFGVRWMNASYLVGRGGELEWNLAPPLHATAADTVGTFSVFERQYRSTTFDLLASGSFPTPESTFLLYVRANSESVSNLDVACGVSGDGRLFVHAQNGRHALVDLPAPIDGPFRLRATINPTIVLCRATIGSESISTTYATTSPIGLYGFGSHGADITIDSLVIDSNDSAPPL